MIIECKSCLTKFEVKDSDIPTKGRVVQCGNCSTKWVQKHIAKNIKKIKPKIEIGALNPNVDRTSAESVTSGQIKTYKGKEYTFLGNQWAEILPSGKTGKLAKKVIGIELDKMSGRSRQTTRVLKENENQIFSEEQKKGMGFFSIIFILLMFFCASILFLDTFKNHITPYWPKLDDYLVYIFETLKNIYIIIKDIINNYK